MLERLEQSIFAIKSLLLNEGDIRKLLCNSSNNCLNMTAPTLEEAQNYITLKPIYQFENKDYEQNGMINLYYTELTPDDEVDTAVSGTLQVNVVYNVDKWELVDNKIRVIQLSNKIIKLLNNKKFNVSNQLTFASMQELIISKTVVGYALLFSITDGNSNLQNF